MKKTKTLRSKNYTVAKSPKDIADALGIDSDSDQKLMEYKVLLSSMAVKVIEKSKLSVNEIVERSGVARSKVSAIKNGALAGISSDLFIKVITGAGGKITFKLVA